MTRQDEFDSIEKALRAEAEQYPVPDSLHPDAIEAMLKAQTAPETATNNESASNTSAPSQPAAPRRHLVRRWPLAAAACLALLCGVGLVTALAGQNTPTLPHPQTPAALQVSDPQEQVSTEEGLATATSYNQVLSCLRASEERFSDSGDIVAFAAGDMARTEATTSFMDTASSKMNSFSDTNVRTEGVGEADVVKTDGDHLYALQDDATTIAIVDPNNGHMTPAGSVTVPKGAQVNEFYVEHNRLYVLSTVYPEGVEQPDGTYTFPPETTRLDTYDVTDPANPTSVGSVTQTGSYHTSRFVDGYVYVFSDQWTFDTAKQEDPAAYTPCVNGAVVSCGDIYLPPAKMGDHYLVITAISANNPNDTVSQKAVLCNAGNVYVSQDSIFLYESTGTEWGIMPIARFAAAETAEVDVAAPAAGEGDAASENPEDTEEPTTGSEQEEPLPGAEPDGNDAAEEPSDTPGIPGAPDNSAETPDVVDDPNTSPGDVTNENPVENPADEEAEEGDNPTEPSDEASDESSDDTAKTCIRKISFHDGQLEGVAQAKVDGIVDDSFCLDEHEGNLRIVTTIYEKNGDTENALYVLNSKLEEVGRIDNIAPGEKVYSARFLGNTGYFVTFEQIDPLFSVDLSDPQNPAIIGELKIPGFSEYLHPYSDNLLLGIGMSADEAGTTDGIKLSMFDTTNPGDVQEIATTVIENAYYSDVFNDYRAALIEPERDMIGFPVSADREAYAVYGYSEGSGFTQHMLEDTNGTGWVSTRGVRIGDVLYVVKGNALESYGTTDYSKIDDLLL